MTPHEQPREPAGFVRMRVEDMVPDTLMTRVFRAGQPILVDLLASQAGSLWVRRLPLRGERRASTPPARTAKRLSGLNIAASSRSSAERSAPRGSSMQPTAPPH